MRCASGRPELNKPLLTLAAWTARWLPPPVKKAIYKIRPLAGLIRQGLNQAVPVGLTEIGVAGGGLAGARLMLDLKQEKDYWLGTYELELQSAMKSLVQSGWVAYDVGANIGYMTLLLARLVGDKGHVVAFEALPANVGRLHTNLRINAEGDRVNVMPAAIAAVSAPVQFLVGPSDDTGKAAGSAGRQLDFKESITVPGISLDDFVYRDGNPPPQVVKMDIEGGEVLALPGMRRILHDARPLLLLELHGQEAAAAAWLELRQADYTLQRLMDTMPEINTLEELGWKEYLLARPAA